jgi:hypothetical protein
MWSSREIVDLVGRRVPRSCVNPEARSGLTELSGRLPDMFSSYYLECRLSAGQEQVDFLACAAESAAYDSARRIRAAARRARGVRRRDPAWQFTWNVLRRWASRSNEWPDKIPFLWLEFDDLRGRPPAHQSPSFGVCVDPGYPDRRIPSIAGDPRDHYESCLAFLTPAVPPAFDGMLSPGNLSSLQRCFHCLPSGGRVIHVSPMAARDPATLKLYVAVPEAHLTGYLSDIGWPGSPDSLRYVMRTFCTAETADDTVYLDLSLDGMLLPRVAITFSQPQLRRLARSDPRRTALLGLLERHGLATPDKCKGLQAWPGSDRESHWSGSTQARIRRWLDVKITIDTDQRLAAKGYLGFAPVSSMF